MQQVEDLSCREFIELVTEYLEHTMPAPERRRYEAHLAECDGCDTYLAQMQETIQLVGRLSEESLSPRIKQDMLTRFRDWTR